MPQVSSQRWFLIAVVVGSISLVGYLFLFHGTDPASWADPAVSRLRLNDIPFDGAQAYDYLRQLCDLGPRPSGSDAMRGQQELLTAHFESLGGTVERQEFTARHPLTGKPVAMANLIVHWHPDRLQRILLCAHYDTRPYPDRDRRRPKGIFVGANDGASGTALLMELGRQMPALEGKLGVDFLLVDGEELVFREDDAYFLGSNRFAQEYVAHPPKHKYRWGIVLDMIGDRDLQIYQEINSITWKDTQPLVGQIWGTAKRLGVREFIARSKHEIRDDHLGLHDIARIPTCDIIDFDYGEKRAHYWHTEQDTADKCSALSLAKVGWVVHEWLKSAVR